LLHYVQLLNHKFLDDFSVQIYDNFIDLFESDLCAY